MEIQVIDPAKKKTNDQKKKAPDLKGEKNISVLSEIVHSLTSVASKLETIRESEANNYFKNLQMKFPKEGIDFRRAKQLYEINLVKQALRQTGGHQLKAAKLLNINATTLNSIIKRHKISC
ncbi:MAG: helix-turn-helix domain-containing protein [Pyrinomonadaceae bacterium]